LDSGATEILRRHTTGMLTRIVVVLMLVVIVALMLQSTHSRPATSAMTEGATGSTLMGVYLVFTNAWYIVVPMGLLSQFAMKAVARRVRPRLHPRHTPAGPSVACR
jgi:preprotein translocase subunit SecG